MKKRVVEAGKTAVYSWQWELKYYSQIWGMVSTQRKELLCTWAAHVPPELVSFVCFASC